ncbi:hypothetical protein ACQWFX_26295, partial [Salmonella enterica subsp. enterica serovar Infantis]
SCQTALYHIAEALFRWMSTMMSFRADEIWGYLPGEREQYVFTGEWYDGLFGLEEKEEFHDAVWDVVRYIKDQVDNELE